MSVRRYNPRRDAVLPSAAKGQDVMSREGNVLLAAELTAWWAQRGYPQVRFIAVPRSTKNRGPTHRQNEIMWTVVSNLVNGLPPRAEDGNRGIGT